MTNIQLPLQFFDCNASVGKIAYKHRLQPWKTEQILSVMDQCGIAGALVYHGMAKAHSPMYGNSVLADELAKSPRLYGCWGAMPDHLGDFISPEQLAANMRAEGIHAVKLFPKAHYYDPGQRTIGPLLAELERQRIPLLVDASEISFDQLADILTHHPALTLLLQGASWSQERRLFPIMDAYDTLCVEFSALQSNAIIEMMYERYGAERLLFGSGMPFKSPGAARSLIDYAQIPNEAKQLIAGGNLCRLLGVTPPEAELPEQDAVVLEASRGLPLSIPVYDSHTHLIEEGGGTGSGFPMLQGTIDPMIAMYRKLGIRKMSIAPWVGINGGDSEAGNAVAEQAVLKYPDEVEAYVVIDPNYVADVEREARKWHVDKGFKGMKPYYFLSHIPYTDPVYTPWWRLGNERRLYALVDPAGQSDAAYTAQIEELAQRYPEVNLFMDHAARTFEIAELYAAVARKYDNVTLQLTYTSVTLGSIEYLVKEVGAHKVLFGTDSPMRDPRPQFGWLAYADLTMEEKEAVFGGNMKRIWDRCLV
ncbi:amidohydrolase family protein [Paenibacillus eucommiae]|uniref:TIM-barrel fold metal-dependent hydrolase n=1 Tax=Paenibacillus eucommiae TaxID=1355755 RepID=A0ABS4J7D5_9BACL|nr:amidohydrolase family protein [Paenibacillus eucommiae]MBP1995757.1 putative TIM-barrel fold metal-dependent hydrolase [Paenibacillus eucommiae]